MLHAHDHRLHAALTFAGGPVRSAVMERAAVLRTKRADHDLIRVAGRLLLVADNPETRSFPLRPCRSCSALLAFRSGRTNRADATRVALRPRRPGRTGLTFRTSRTCLSGLTRRAGRSNRSNAPCLAFGSDRSTCSSLTLWPCWTCGADITLWSGRPYASSLTFGSRGSKTTGFALGARGTCRPPLLQQVPVGQEVQLGLDRPCCLCRNQKGQRRV